MKRGANEHCAYGASKSEPLKLTNSFHAIALPRWRKKRIEAQKQTGLRAKKAALQAALWNTLEDLKA